MQRSFSDLFFNVITGQFKNLADLGKQFGRDFLGDQALERPGIDQAFRRLDVLENVARIVLGVGALEAIVA